MCGGIANYAARVGMEDRRLWTACESVQCLPCSLLSPQQEHHGKSRSISVTTTLVAAGPIGMMDMSDVEMTQRLDQMTEVAGKSQEASLTRTHRDGA